MQTSVKFLLVDDLEANLLALEGLLRRDGLELLMARSGPEALELLLVHEVALAILDVQMPEMDGFELAELMRGAERTRRVPIIFVTAGAVDQQRRFRGYEAGAVDFLFKPIEPHILKSKAQVFFDLARQRDALLRSVEEAKAASRAKDDFLAALSHELRTPLAPVLLTATALLDDSSIPEDAKKQIAMMRRNVELEARLIDDLLDLTRISRGKLLFHPVVTDIHELIRHSEEIVRSELPSGIDLHVSIEAEDHHVKGDPARIQQVLWNLMKNAVKFTGASGQVMVRTANPSQGRLAIEVTDTGIGIAPSALGRIFQPFDQGDLGSKHRFGGLGLGLSISKAIVELHNGELRVASPGLGKGATFTVELRTVSSPARTMPRSLPEAVDGIRLLVVEDHDSTRDALVRLLQRDGYQVVAASGVAEALTVAKGHECDVVVSDLSLPDGTGLELMREISTRYGWAGIALSGFGMESDIRESSAAGFGAHLVKPVDMADLRRAISEVLAHTPKIAPQAC